MRLRRPTNERRARHAAGSRQPGRMAGTKARGPAPEPSRIGRNLAIAPGVLALLGAIYVAPHALDHGRLRIRQAPFQVEHVVVQGLERIPLEELRGVLAPARGVPLVDLDAAPIERQLAAHPWVAEVTTLRWPPSTLKVRVVERTALAVTAAGGDGEPHAVDLTGMAFAPASETDVAHLVAIALASPAPVGEPDARLAEALALAARFQTRGLEVPRRVTLGLPDREASAELRLRGFAPAIFIERDAPAAQLDRLAQLLSANVAPAMTARVIDLRFDGRAVLWDGS
jgi:hypothetical protein